MVVGKFPRAGYAVPSSGIELDSAGACAGSARPACAVRTRSFRPLLIAVRRRQLTGTARGGQCCAPGFSRRSIVIKLCGGCGRGPAAEERPRYTRFFVLMADSSNASDDLFEKHSSSCAPSRIRTCAHGSGGRLRTRRRAYSDLRKRLDPRDIGRRSIAILSRHLNRGGDARRNCTSAARRRVTRKARACGSCPAKSRCGVARLSNPSVVHEVGAVQRRVRPKTIRDSAAFPPLGRA
jgi:hypothetical protein